MRWLRPWIQRLALGDVQDHEAALHRFRIELERTRALMGAVYEEVGQTAMAMDAVLSRLAPPADRAPGPHTPPRAPRNFTIEDRQTGITAKE